MARGYGWSLIPRDWIHLERIINELGVVALNANTSFSQLSATVVEVSSISQAVSQAESAHNVLASEASQTDSRVLVLESEMSQVESAHDALASETSQISSLLTVVSAAGGGGGGGDVSTVSQALSQTDSRVLVLESEMSQIESAHDALASETSQISSLLTVVSAAGGGGGGDPIECEIHIALVALDSGMAF